MKIRSAGGIPSSDPMAGRRSSSPGLLEWTCEPWLQNRDGSDLLLGQKLPQNSPGSGVGGFRANYPRGHSDVVEGDVGDPPRQCLTDDLQWFLKSAPPDELARIPDPSNPTLAENAPPDGSPPQNH